MRKLLAVILCVVAVLLLCSCEVKPQQQIADEPVDVVPVLDTTSGFFAFPEGCVVGGVDLQGMLAVNALDVLSEAAQNYNIKIKINNDVMILWADDLGLSFSEDLMWDYVNALKEGKDPRSIVPFTYDADSLRYKIAEKAFTLPTNVSLRYNDATDSYVLIDAVPGSGYDLDPIMEALDATILSLGSEFITTVPTIELTPSFTAEGEYAKAALEEANRLLATDLSYSANLKNPNALTATLDADAISTFYTFDEYLKPVLHEEAVYAYAEELREPYAVGTNDGKFLTSLGEYIDININYTEKQVDAEALAADILYCFENGITGTREMPYNKVEKKGRPYDLGGNYVEVNLTEQCLWVYNNYECKLYSPIVTGNLSEGWNTPTGVYSVYDTIHPTRPGRVFRYWCPFLGAYGLHDANWRSEFRSDEYLFEGSHGCVNIPPENFKVVYANISVGTPVIIYGGADKGNPVTQVISGTSTYNVGVDTEKFTLDATPKYGETKHLTYTSDNTDVATVTKQGIVKVHSTGTAHITVKSKNWNFCASVTKVVTIHVHEDCSKTGHMIVNWKQTKAPTCKTEGTEVGTCTSCDYTETRTIPVKHDFYFAAYMHDQNWIVTKWPTCSEAGEKYHTCEDCGYTETMEIPAVDHVGVNWHVTKPATATEAGELTGTCYYCDKVITKDIPATN